ncbi:DNA-binding response regulator [Paenibacillus lemnae]|uniref:DNA-binding response regulator n=1 Tax=Paenibacillus lemnae TaxID=1330551 RepID=A0A848M4K2_PAELE|nr:DNA-binding response regulator [Paenibacillus lemnae]NMO96008.1 DNA-binding response regulator [Paenibacillus lemnae]
MVNYEDAHEQFVESHLSRRSGERYRRLKESHAYGEQLFLQAIWWPTFGNFDHLHPEYEVADLEDNSRYIDFAYLRGGISIAIELDGYGPHVRHCSRFDFSKDRWRQNSLIYDGWKLIRFTVDDLKEKPRRCAQFLQQCMGRWYGSSISDTNSVGPLSVEERLIIRYIRQRQVSVKPADICTLFGVGKSKSLLLLQGLLSKGLLEPDGNSTIRIRSYKLARKLTLQELAQLDLY